MSDAGSSDTEENPIPDEEINADKKDGQQHKNPSREELVKELQSFNANTNGSEFVLVKRLQQCKRQSGNKFSWPQFYDYLLVIDFEATCQEDNDDYPHEIIEFPVVLYDVNNFHVQDIFHSYVRPGLFSKLSDFCIKLTKIQQSTIDIAPAFHDVLQKVEQWLFDHHQLKLSKLAVVCDCNSDMAQFMRMQCEISGIRVPKWCQHWINLKKTFRNFYKIPYENRVNLKAMLKHLDLKFDGQCHSGLDDAKNITQVVNALLEDNCSLIINQSLCYKSKYYARGINVKEAQKLITKLRRSNYSVGSNTSYKLINKIPKNNSAVDQSIQIVHLSKKGEVHRKIIDQQKEQQKEKPSVLTCDNSSKIDHIASDITIQKSDKSLTSQCFNRRFLFILLFLLSVLIACSFTINAIISKFV